MRLAVHHVVFTSDGQAVAAIDEFGESRTWPVPEPLQDAGSGDLTMRIEAHTGLRMEKGLEISRLNRSVWRERLEQLGRLDPAAVQFEDGPAWHEPMLREADRQAELARVFELGADQGLVIPRAEDLGRGGRWSEAARLLGRCGRTGPLSRELAQAWCIACLRADDYTGYREACAAVSARDWPGPIVAWDATQAGSLLDADYPTYWAYLALAHARKGNVAEGRRWLERLRAFRPASSITFWDLQELALLQSEVESLLFDAAFPADPF